MTIELYYSNWEDLPRADVDFNASKITNVKE